MPKRDLKIRWPLAGLNRRLAGFQQPPYTTPHCINTRPEGPIESRMRGGSRPGLVKTSATRIGTGSPIYMAAMMRSLKSEGRATFVEPFDDVDDWTALSWPVDGGLALHPTQSWVMVPSWTSVGSALNLAVLEDQDIKNASSGIIDAPYTVEVYIKNLPASGVRMQYASITLYARLDDTSPSQTQPTWVSCVFGHDGHVSLQANLGGLGRAEIAHAYDVTGIDDVWLRLTIGQRTLGAELVPGPTANVSYLSVSGILPAPLAGKSRVALTINNRSSASAHLDQFAVRFFSTVRTEIPPEALVVASKHDGAGGKAGSNVWYESATGTFTELPCKRDSGAAGEETDLAHGVHLMAVDHLSKLYIADYGVKSSGTDGEVADDPWTVFSVAAGTNWGESHADAVGVDEHGDWLEILSTGTSGYAILGVYKITGVTDTNITVDRAMAVTSNEEAIRYRIVRGPKVFEPGAAAGSRLTRWEPDAGSATGDGIEAVQHPPINCTIIESGLRDRVVLGGDDELPGVFYFSRANEWDDFNYFAEDTDPERAFAGHAVSTQVGGLSINLSSIKVMAEDYTVFSAESEMYIYRGDPGYGAIMGNISRQIGVGSRTALCLLPDGTLVFMTRDGLYKYHPRTFPEPVSLSRDKLPDDLLDVVQNTSLIVSLEYDVRSAGVHIFVVPIVAGPTTHYFFDWPTQGFNAVTLGSTDFEPTAIVFNSKTNQLILAGRDGYLRHYDRAAKDDDGTAVTKEVDLGPIPLNRGRLAIADSLEIVLDDASDDVSWSFRSAQTPEEAFTAAPRASGTVSAGSNYRQTVRHSGQWGFLRLSTTGSVRWAMEDATLRVLTMPAEQRKI